MLSINEIKGEMGEEGWSQWKRWGVLVGKRSRLGHGGVVVGAEVPDVGWKG